MELSFKHQAAGDAAYLSFTSDRPAGFVKATYECDFSSLPASYGIPEITAMINLDFDKDGLLVGIEFIGAQNVLPAMMFEK